MKNILVIILAVFVCSSCIKKEQQQNNESKILDLLNQNKSEEALDKINAELVTNSSDEMLYLKASALSMKAGIDIYALFPLLKIKIFDVAIAQWSQNREFQKRADAKKINIGIDPEDIKKEKNDLKKDYVPLKMEDIQYEAALSLAKPFNDETQFCGVNIRADKNLEAYSANRVYLTYRLYKKDHCEELMDKGSASEFKLSENDSFYYELDALIKVSISEQHRMRWMERKAVVKKKTSYLKALGTFWTLIDMVPMVSKIPRISMEGFKSLEEAQEILLKIRENRKSNKKDELNQKARKQLMMLSALKIVAHLQNSFDLQDIKSPIDFICKSNDQAASEFVASAKDAFFLVDSIEDPEIREKNKQMFEDINTNSKSLKSDLENPVKKEEHVQSLARELLRSKKANCEGDGSLDDLF
jgi:hypothetical protein